jgi:hypothetical protein
MATGALVARLGSPTAQHLRDNIALLAKILLRSAQWATSAQEAPPLQCPARLLLVAIVLLVPLNRLAKSVPLEASAQGALRTRQHARRRLAVIVRPDLRARAGRCVPPAPSVWEARQPRVRARASQEAIAQRARRRR